MSERLLLSEYTKDYILQIEKEYAGINKLGEMCQVQADKTGEIWKSIYEVMNEEFGSKKEYALNDVYDVIKMHAEDFDHYFLEALYYLKYSLKRSEKSLFILSPDDEADSQDLKSIERELFSEQCRDKTCDIEIDFFHTIQRIHKDQIKFSSNIEFEWRLLKEEGKLELLEDNFWILQLMILVNDRFNSVFTNGKNKKQYEFPVLNNIRIALKKAERKLKCEDVDSYMWEKLTRMNTAVFLTNYYMKILGKFENYDLSKQQLVGDENEKNTYYDAPMIVGIETVQYTKKDFEKDMQHLARYIGDTPSFFSALLLIKRYFDFVLKNERLNLCETVKKLERYVVENFTDRESCNSCEMNKIELFAKILIYLRNKCFLQKESYAKRKRDIMCELEEVTCREFIKILYADFDEEQWYWNMTDKMVYLKTIVAPNLDSGKIKLQLKNKMKEEFEVILARYVLGYSCESIGGRLLLDNIRMDYINRVKDEEVRIALKRHNEEWRKELIKKLKDIIQSRQWENFKELGDNLLRAGWTVKETVLRMLQDVDEGFTEEKLVKEMEHFLADNFNPFIYKEDRTLFQQRFPEILQKDWEKEYKMMQNLLLYHKN